MFPMYNHHQATFVYGPEIYEKLIPEDHILCKINKQVDFSFVNEACKDLYSKYQGRPVKYLPEIMFRSAIVQYMNDYSDRDTEEAARYNLIIKWFLGIRIEDHSYDHSILGDFRDRLVENKLVSLVDKDARHGAKSDSKPFMGYKANIMKSDDGFVTNIIGTGGNTYAVSILVPLVSEKIEKRSKPSKIADDTHYGSAENRYQMSQRGITIVAPIKEDFNPTGLYSQEKFVLDKTGVTCPAGNRTMISNYNEKEGTTIFYFKKEICQQCSLKNQCTKQEGRTITIGKHHELIMEAKEYNKTQAFKDDMKERAHIEPKHAEMKRFHGMARARYWGLSKVNVQFIITAIVVNVKRLANVIDSVCYLKM